jgi:hypothetical protein
MMRVLTALLLDTPSAELSDDPISQALSCGEDEIVSTKMVNHKGKTLHKKLEKSSRRINPEDFRIPSRRPSDSPHSYSCSDGFEGKERTLTGRVMKLKNSTRREFISQTLPFRIPQLDLVADRDFDLPSRPRKSGDKLRKKIPHPLQVRIGDELEDEGIAINAPEQLQAENQDPEVFQEEVVSVYEGTAETTKNTLPNPESTLLDATESEVLKQDLQTEGREGSIDARKLRVLSAATPKTLDDVARASQHSKLLQGAFRTHVSSKVRAELKVKQELSLVKTFWIDDRESDGAGSDEESSSEENSELEDEDEDEGEDDEEEVEGPDGYENSLSSDIHNRVEHQEQTGEIVDDEGDDEVDSRSKGNTQTEEIMWKDNLAWVVRRPNPSSVLVCMILSRFVSDSSPFASFIRPLSLCWH